MEFKYLFCRMRRALILAMCVHVVVWTEGKIKNNQITLSFDESFEWLKDIKEEI